MIFAMELEELLAIAPAYLARTGFVYDTYIMGALADLAEIWPALEARGAERGRRRQSLKS